jgi:hypothetical protein
MKKRQLGINENGKNISPNTRKKREKENPGETEEEGRKKRGEGFFRFSKK